MAQLVSQCLCVQTSHQETSQITSQRIRGGSATAATSYGACYDNNKRLETFNYYHKMLHPRRLSNLISDSVNINYLVFKYAIKNRKTAKNR